MIDEELVNYKLEKSEIEYYDRLEQVLIFNFLRDHDPYGDDIKASPPSPIPLRLLSFSL